MRLLGFSDKPGGVASHVMVSFRARECFNARGAGQDHVVEDGACDVACVQVSGPQLLSGGGSRAQDGLAWCALGSHRTREAAVAFGPGRKGRLVRRLVMRAGGVVFSMSCVVLSRSATPEMSSLLQTFAVSTHFQIDPRLLPGVLRNLLVDLRPLPGPRSSP